MWVEDKIDLAYILEERVKYFNKDLDQVEDSQLAFFLINYENEDQRCVASENDFRLRWQSLTITDEVCRLCT